MKNLKWILSAALTLGVASAYATCAGTAGAVYALEEVSTNVTASNVDTGNKDVGYKMSDDGVTFNPTATAGHCNNTCAGATDTYFGTGTTFTQSDIRLISSTSAYGDRDNTNVFVSNTDAIGTLYKTVELMDANSCTCTETISGTSYYFHKVCMLP